MEMRRRRIRDLRGGELLLLRCLAALPTAAPAAAAAAAIVQQRLASRKSLSYWIKMVRVRRATAAAATRTKIEGIRGMKDNNNKKIAWLDEVEKWMSG